MKYQGNETESPSDDPILPEVYTATVVCIYSVDGKCKGILTLEHFNILQREFQMAKCSGLHDNIHPPPILASEITDLIIRKDIATSKHTHCSAANFSTFANSWAPYHQTNSNVLEYPSELIYRHPFPNTLGICTSLPYGILKAGTASMLATKLAKRACQRNF